MLVRIIHDWHAEVKKFLMVLEVLIEVQLVMSESYQTLRQMNTIEILKQAISLYRQNFQKFLGVVLPGIPVVIFCILIFSLIFSEFFVTILSAPIPKASEIAKGDVYKKIVPIMMLIFFLMYFLSTIVAAAGTIVISEFFL